MPDLIHELGHHILKVYGDIFTNPYKLWFEECQADLERELLLSYIRDSKHIEESKKIFPQRWPDWWAEEVVCDLIATYCLGQAFAWTNLKLCQHLPYDMSYSIYDYSETHPADNCRMEAILLMLSKLGIAGEEIQQTWMDYEKIISPNRPTLYEFYFPNDLIKKITSHVFQSCDDIGLIPCSKNLNRKVTFVWRLQQAWQLFQP